MDKTSVSDPSVLILCDLRNIGSDMQSDRKNLLRFLEGEGPFSDWESALLIGWLDFVAKRDFWGTCVATWLDFWCWQQCTCRCLACNHQMHFIPSSLNTEFQRYGPFTDKGVNCSVATFQHFSAVKVGLKPRFLFCLEFAFSVLLVINTRNINWKGLDRLQCVQFKTKNLVLCIRRKCK